MNVGFLQVSRRGCCALGESSNADLAPAPALRRDSLLNDNPRFQRKRPTLRAALRGVVRRLEFKLRSELQPSDINTVGGGVASESAASVAVELYRLERSRSNI